MTDIEIQTEVRNGTYIVHAMQEVEPGFSVSICHAEMPESVVSESTHDELAELLARLAAHSEA